MFLIFSIKKKIFNEKHVTELTSELINFRAFIFNTTLQVGNRFFFNFLELSFNGGCYFVISVSSTLTGAFMRTTRVWEYY